MAGLPTVLITVDPESSGTLRPPRAISPEGFHFGHSLGNAGNVALQTEILRTALRQLEELHMPGQVRILPFKNYEVKAGAAH